MDEEIIQDFIAIHLENKMDVKRSIKNISSQECPKNIPRGPTEENKVPEGVDLINDTFS